VRKPGDLGGLVRESFLFEEGTQCK